MTTPSTPADVVMVVDDDEFLRASIGQWLRIAGYDVLTPASAKEALSELDRFFPGAIVTDLRMPDISGIELLKIVGARDRDIPVVLISAFGDIPLTVDAMRHGAYDFLEKPFEPERLLDVVRRACEKRRLTLENRFLQVQLAGSGIESRLLGVSDAIKRLRRQVLEVAATPVNVLIYGETGSGKELVARSIHDYSTRRSSRYVAINCGAIPENLFEAELFGSEPGAYTGATKQRIGRIEYANRGTLFLDEIESMPLPLQVKFLRVLEDQTIERLGSNESRLLDLRTIAASKTELRDAPEFRSDLYFRLAIAEIRIPPLRQRPEDIPILFEHFATQAAMKSGRALRPPDEHAHHLLSLELWPGNVRELRNAAERYALGLDADAVSQPAPASRSLTEQMNDIEKRIIESTLHRTRGNIAEALDQLQIPRRTLNEKMQKHNIDRQRFR